MDACEKEKELEKKLLIEGGVEAAGVAVSKEEMPSSSAAAE